jgi:GxxExxY protein
MTNEELNQLSKRILLSAIEVHREMGPGLLESVYEICLEDELKAQGIECKRQIVVPLIYKGKVLSKDFRIDLLVENEIIIEAKAVEFLLPVHEAQVISYLKLSNKKLGFLINFNVPLLKDGFHRFVNKF